ncbi:MAG: Ku protein, partial [Thermoanaerobaculia bacterium]
MRAIWTGEISFGLVAIPVKLYSATKDLTPRFHLIHKTCGSRIQQKRWCPKEEIEVPWDEVEKGFEVHKGKYAK